ncbi:DUF58 domain-containing protein [Neptuniibacter sp. CAU 1671]|uniref:DUF58 domain-containing protein n=1 Tax=Neptuniibacter sp. CAU 1671 TaxID=3032593 RepID=UPI0023DBB2A5|nr:DUF58 domain-containing protein [Neptuniibacter sp. CAU 1671]MDF2180913.1 DUF58 domain-containing protein [Neptuniibacter sp. CAU 1671]
MPSFADCSLKLMSWAEVMLPTAGDGTFLSRWMARRRPKSRNVTLTHKNIFIFPTLAGWFYLLLCVLLFLIATNYQNNLIHAVVYFLLALGILTIHYTFLNLSGLQIRFIKAHACYAGELAETAFQLVRNGRPADTIQLNWRGHQSSVVSLEQGETSVTLYSQTQHRGIYRPGLLCVSTVYPFGLLRAWSWLEPPVEIYVYPQPLKGRAPTAGGVGEEGPEIPQQGGADFTGYALYQPGAPLSQIDWKQYARRGELLLKQYPEHQDKRLWLNWQDWPELGVEQRLSVICYWALQWHRAGLEYGLSLPGQQLEPGSGPLHLQQVLERLASFPAAGGAV